MASNPAGASWLQSLRPVRRVAELLSLAHITHHEHTRSLFGFPGACSSRYQRASRSIGTVQSRRSDDRASSHLVGVRARCRETGGRRLQNPWRPVSLRWICTCTSQPRIRGCISTEARASLAFAHAWVVDDLCYAPVCVGMKTWANKTLQPLTATALASRTAL
jgi:hypothetical protein